MNYVQCHLSGSVFVIEVLFRAGVLRVSESSAGICGALYARQDILLSSQTACLAVVASFKYCDVSS